MRRMFPKSEILSEQVPLVPGSSSTLVPDLCKSCPSRHLLIASVILVIIAISWITALPAQISAPNFHDLTQITQRRVRFNPKRTVFPCALG